MKKVYIILFLQILLLIFSVQNVYSCIIDNKGQDFLILNGSDFKVGDLVVFKKNEQGILLQGKITEINNNNAVIEYIDPSEPNKTKESIVELTRLTKIIKIESKSDLELNMPIIFKKVNNERLWEGKVTGINKSGAIIEFIDPLEPSKVKEYEAEFNRMYRLSSTIKKEVKSEVKIEELPKIKNDLKIGDFVKFKKLNGVEFEGKILVLNENIAEVEYIDASEPEKIKSIEKNVIELTKINKLTKIEKEIVVIKEEKVKENKIKIKPTYLKNTIAVDGLQFVFKRASVWYEYKFKELIGLRIPFYFGWTSDAGIYSLGVNPKFYFNKSKIIKGFAGPSVIVSIEPKAFYHTFKSYYDPYTGNSFVYYNQFYCNYLLDILGDVGVAITPIKLLNITLNCSAGLRMDFGGHNDFKKFIYYPELSVGWNF